MKKGFIPIVLVVILLLLSIYLFRTSNRVKTIYVETEEEMLEDPSIVEAFDEEGNLIYSRRDTASESTKLVNTSLNGEVFYKLAHGKGYVKTEVFKYDYRKENFYVTFSNDTVSAIAPFQASISLNKTGVTKAILRISHAERYNIEKEESEYGIKYIYKDKSPQKGENTFEGEIALDEHQYPIRFNYFFK